MVKDLDALRQSALSSPAASIIFKASDAPTGDHPYYLDSRCPPSLHPLLPVSLPQFPWRYLFSSSFTNLIQSPPTSYHPFYLQSSVYPVMSVVVDGVHFHLHKVKIESSENDVIRENNEKLIYENSVLKEALRAAKCSSCRDSDSSQLVQENAKLQLEYSMVRSQFVLDITKQFARPLLDLVGAPRPLSSTQNPGSEDLHIYEAAKKATDELIKHLVMDDVFWVKSETEGQSVLNLANYQRILSPRTYFIRNDMLKESLKASGLVHLSGKTLVELLLD